MTTLGTARPSPAGRVTDATTPLLLSREHVAAGCDLCNAAIRVDDLTVHPVGVSATQERNYIGDVLWFAEPSVRRALCETGNLLFRFAVGEQCRVDDAGSYCIDGDVPPGQLLCQHGGVKFLS